MRRPVEICLVALAAMSGIVLFGGGAPSGMSPLSVLEARTVIGGGPPMDSSCSAGEDLAIEGPPGTGCDSTCLRMPNVFSSGERGNHVPKMTDCPNACGRFAVAVSNCGS
jgi:hypothetical protein